MDTISNRQLTLLRKLQKKKYREREQLFLVEGERAVEQVIQNGTVQVTHLFWDENQQLWKRPGWSERAGQLLSAKIDPQSFREITDTDNPQGILALCEMPPEVALDELSDKQGVVVATDRIQDPGNLGTILRSAAWFGVQGLLLGKGTVDLFNPKVVRSTAGATGTIPFVNVNLEQTLSFFEEKGWQVLLLDTSEHAESLRTVEAAPQTIVVIGNEANGVDPSLMAGRNRRVVEIPHPQKEKQVESLNASIALSIALYALSGQT
ncbi:TrmH family RNA methyltransferase [Halalkalibaculum sp. DA3122]|uniref:TrmH family RNA methyltransferase n=1 Tax=Halalkalibaculum sp. DA3122 TaxID=3373607 RepID=UPI0037545F20